MIKKQFKRGIAMIELIFSLVIMGIVLMSAPMLIQQSIASSNVALQQEAIAAIASHTGILLSKHWDEGDTNLSAGLAPIITLNNPTTAADTLLNLDGVDFDNNVSGRSSSVAGVNVMASTVLGQDAGDFDDIDDYNGVDINLTVFNGEESTSGELGDYVDEDINIFTRVTYADDMPLGGILGANTNIGNNIFTNTLPITNESHIKFIEVTLTTDSDVAELNKTIILRAFSSNLGTYSLGGRQYP